MDTDWMMTESQQTADLVRDLRAQLDAEKLAVAHTQQAYLAMADTADKWMQAASYNQRLFEQAQAARAQAEEEQAAERLTHAGEAHKSAVAISHLIQRSQQAEAALAAAKPCVWSEDSNGIWYTACNDAWEMSEGTPERSGYKHCPKCGNLIIADPWVEPVEPDEPDEPEPAAVQP